MEGVIGGEYYDVPSVPDVMYFTNVGHAIHGTYSAHLGTGQPPGRAGEGRSQQSCAQRIHHGVTDAMD